MSRTVLIDADIAAFQVASSSEAVFEFNGRHVLHADLNEGIRELDNLIEWIIEMTGADYAALMLTGSNNFRKKVLPTYKANRANVRKPMILGGLRDHLLSKPNTYIEDTLEGDDLIGIYATEAHLGERVIYSADKDLKTIAGLHWSSDDGEVYEITEAEADRLFYQQVLTGDATDNYKGCPSWGPVKAQKLLDKCEAEGLDVWSCVWDAYVKAGLTEKDALQQARCARILRNHEFNRETKEINLWSPYTQI